MKHSKVLLVANGFLGDNLFISSVAEKLLNESRATQVDFLTGFPQVYPLLKENPFITDVFVTEQPTQYPQLILNNYDVGTYDQVFSIPPFSFKIPPAYEAQLFCGIENSSAAFTVYTSPEDDVKAMELISSLKKNGKPVITWMRNWRQKAYKFTEDQYFFGSDDPRGLTGYGTENRDVDYIVKELSKDFNMIAVGVPENMSQLHTAQYEHEYRTFSEEASILKFCDYFIGTEGGLANLASGVGCKTILTYEFMWQCYGPRGTVRPFENGPMLGPVYYFPEGHTYLPLYKTDEEIITLIKDLIV